VIFGEHSSITSIGKGAFQECYALTSITLPDKLEVIVVLSFTACSALERVVFNKNLKTIGSRAFAMCPVLKEVQLASSSISFGDNPFVGCDRLIELTDAAGFPSNAFSTTETYGAVNKGDGVVPYLLDRIERSVRFENRKYVLLANIRYNVTVHAFVGTEKEKVAAAKLLHPRKDTLLVAELLHKINEGGGVKGVLWTILSFV